MIVERYLMRQVFRPFLFVCIVLVLIFTGYSSSLFLGAASEGLISRDVVLRLIALKTVVAMEVLVPIALYLTVVVGLGRLYANHEMTALRALGFGTSRVLRAVWGVVLPVAVLAGALSVFVRPWAYRQMYALREQVEQGIDLSRLKGGRFYFDDANDRVLFVDEADGNGGLRRVFLAIGSGERRKVFSAPEGSIEIGKGSANQTLLLDDVHIYGMDRDPLSVASIGELELPLRRDTQVESRYRRKAASTGWLLQSTDSEDRAELQWRLSRLMSTLLLGTLAVFLSFSDPRRGRNTSVFAATLVYLIYYMTAIVARSWVRHGIVGSFPGMYWVDALLGAVVAWKVAAAFRDGRKGRQGAHL